MVVDDEGFNHLNYETLIDKYFKGSKMDGIRDGDKAIKWLEEKGFNFYDLIFMDYQMPNLNGVVTAK